MADSTYKLIELVGTSNRSYADATTSAIRRASKTLQGLSWFEVVEMRGSIENGRIKHFQVKVKVAFKLLDGGDLGGAGTGKKR